VLGAQRKKSWSCSTYSSPAALSSCSTWCAFGLSLPVLVTGAVLELGELVDQVVVMG